MGMKASDYWEIPVTSTRIEWSEVKDRIDLAMVATNLLGAAHQRRGQRLLWPCPFHDDHDPSFDVNLTKKLWYCRVCAFGGDAADLVQRVMKVDFPAAVKFLADLSGVISPSRGTVPVIVATKPASPLPEQPSGLPLDEASTLIDQATACLWGPGGENARAYLHNRGLTDETIKERGLGWIPSVMLPTKDGDCCFEYWGVVIPWRDGARLTRIKIRRFPFPDRKPKYAEAYSSRPLIYPDPGAVRPGKPLIVSEGEFDCMLLAQQLPEASVITLGSASARTDPAVLSRMLSSPRWFAALDADQAGDSAASKFPARAIRVRPPDKDWGEVHAGGANRIRYLWGRYLLLSKPIEFTTLETAP